MIKLLDILKEVHTPTLKTGKGSIIYGVMHGNLSSAQKIVDDIIKKYPPDTKLVFMGEGGDSNNTYVAGSENEYVFNKLKSHYNNLTNYSWDGKDFDVTNPSAPMFATIKSITGLNKALVLAGVYAAMVGQDQNPSEVSKLLTSQGIEWLQSFGVKNPENPDHKDKQLMYDLSFPQDTGGQVQGVSAVVDAYNKARQMNIIKKLREWEGKGYKVVVLAGRDHLRDLKIS